MQANLAVQDMKVRLTNMHPQLETASREIEKMMVRLGQEKKEADDT